MQTLDASVVQKAPSRSRLKGMIGAFVGLAITIVAVFVLMHALKHVNFAEVADIIRHTSIRVVVAASTLVALSYGATTFYDWFALRTIGRSDVPYRIAALASFTSYPISHGVGVVSLVSPVIRYRIYSRHGLHVIDVANICFLTGLTFWLGNLTALGLSLLYEPNVTSLIDHLPALVNRLLAAMMLLAVVVFLIWSWFNTGAIGIWRWPVRLPSGPMVLLQIVIGIADLAAAALAMYVLLPTGADIGISRMIVVFIVATILGFASQTPAGLGVFDAAILIGLGNGEKEAVIASLLLFRFLYHFLPFVLSLTLFAGVESSRIFGNAPKGHP